MGLGHSAPPSPSPVAAAAMTGVKAPIEFTLNDADGNPHQYMVVQHPADTGQDLMWALVSFAGEPLGAVAKKLVTAGAAGGLDASVISEIDWGQLGKDIASSVDRTDMARLTTLLVANTTRDNQWLKDQAVFKGAFQANYSELMMLLWKVIEVNRFLPL